MTLSARAGEGFDWLRGKVNESWYNAVIGKCENREPQRLTKAECEQKKRVGDEAFRQIEEKVFFDHIVKYQAVQNRCAHDYWRSLATDFTEDPNVDWPQARAELLRQHPELGDQLMPKGLRKIEEARKAQNLILQNMIESAWKLQDLRERLKPLIEVKGRRNPEISYKDPVKAKAIMDEIEIVKASVPMAGNRDGQFYFNFEVTNALARDPKLRQRPIAEVIETLQKNPKTNFQERVVKPQMQQLIAEQKKLADMRGIYSNQHTFKTTAFESGVAGELLLGASGGIAMTAKKDFSHMYCRLDSRYGMGSEISTFSHTLLATGLTAGVGGGAFLLGRLAQMGVVSVTSARIAAIVSTSISVPAAAGEVAYAIAESCGGKNFDLNKNSICSSVKAIQSRGVTSVVKDDIATATCALNIGIAALGGTVALKSFIASRRLGELEIASNLGVGERYAETLARVRARRDLSPTQRKKIENEMARAVRSFRADGRPSSEFLNALGTEDPIALERMLSQINGVNKPTWREKINEWMRRLGLKGKEKQELEACLLRTDAVSCPYAEKNNNRS